MNSITPQNRIDAAGSLLQRAGELGLGVVSAVFEVTKTGLCTHVWALYPPEATSSLYGAPYRDACETTPGSEIVIHNVLPIIEESFSQGLPYNRYLLERTVRPKCLLWHNHGVDQAFGRALAAAPQLADRMAKAYLERSHHALETLTKQAIEPARRYRVSDYTRDLIREAAHFDYIATAFSERRCPSIQDLMNNTGHGAASREPYANLMELTPTPSALISSYNEGGLLSTLMAPVRNASRHIIEQHKGRLNALTQSSSGLSDPGLRFTSARAMGEILNDALDRVRPPSGLVPRSFASAYHSGANFKPIGVAMPTALPEQAAAEAFRL